MNKENVKYRYVDRYRYINTQKEILFSLKKGENLAIWNNTDVPGVYMPSKITRHKMTNSVYMNNLK